jgi:hypothetical protein
MIPTTLDFAACRDRLGRALGSTRTRIIDWSAKLDTQVELLDGELRVAV